MRLTSVLGGLVAIASYATAQEASAEDVAIVQQQLEAVVAAVTELDAGVRAFSGLNDAASLQATSQAVIDALTNGAAAVEPVTGPITVIQASSTLLDPVQRLNAAVETAVQGAIDQKPVFVEAGVGAVILDQLTRQGEAAATFRSTIAGKFAEADRGLVNDLSQPALDSLQRAIDAYADQAGGTTPPPEEPAPEEPAPEEPAPEEPAPEEPAPEEPAPEEPAPEEPAPEEPAPEEPAPEEPAPETPPPTDTCDAPTPTSVSPVPETPPPVVTDKPEPPPTGGDYTTTVTVGVCPGPVTVTVSECPAQTQPAQYGRYWRAAKGYGH